MEAEVQEALNGAWESALLPFRDAWSLGSELYVAKDILTHLTQKMTEPVRWEQSKISQFYYLLPVWWLSFTAWLSAER